MRLVDGLRPDRWEYWGAYTALPRPSSWIKAEGRREGRREGREWETGGGRKGREKERGGPPNVWTLKCVDAHANLPIIKQLLMFWHSGALCTGVPECQRLIKIVNKWWLAYYIRRHLISTCCWNWQRLKSNQCYRRYWWTAICIMPTWLPSCRFLFG